MKQNKDGPVQVTCVNSKRKWQSWFKAGDKTVGVMKFEEIVVQHDLKRLGNSVFWRGAEIRPQFSL